MEPGVVIEIPSLCLDLNRVSFLENGICEFLAHQIAYCSDHSKEESSNAKYKSVVCGCVLNLAADNGKHNKHIDYEMTAIKIRMFLIFG